MIELLGLQSRPHHGEQILMRQIKPSEGTISLAPKTVLTVVVTSTTFPALSTIAKFEVPWSCAAVTAGWSE